jgi:hypothetical protein
MSCHVTAVVTLAYHALVAWNFLAEGVLTAHKEEEHCECLCEAAKGSGI